MKQFNHEQMKLLSNIHGLFLFLLVSEEALQLPGEEYFLVEEEDLNTLSLSETGLEGPL